MSRRYFFDSTALMLHFLGQSETARRLVEDYENDLYCSILSFFEVAKSMERKKAGRSAISASLEIMRRRFNAVFLTEEICLKAAADSLAYDLYAIDSLIYRSAQDRGATLVTDDLVFRKKRLKNVLIL